MSMRTKFIVILLLMSFAVNAEMLLGDNKPQAVTYPYIAKSDSGNINIRSGGGTAYYSCGKLNAGQKVTVIGEEFNWSKILPPPGSFSWISKKYVKIDSDNPKKGWVTGDNVRVWVGSPLLGALTSSTSQTKLSQKNSDSVQLLGEEEEGYLKIAPPEGACLYVRSDNLSYVGPVEVEKKQPSKTVTPQKKPEPRKEPILDEPVKATPEKTVERKSLLDEEIKQPEPVSSTSTPTEIELIAKCKEFVKKLDVERKKPLDEQNYDAIKQEVLAILEQDDAGKAKEYAKYLKDLIGRFELAIMVEQAIEQHRVERIETKRTIKTKHAQAVAEVKNPGKYIVTGILKPSNIFNAESGVKRYRICQDNGKTICYAQPSGRVPDNLIKKYYGKKVSLVGTTTPSFYSAVGLVKFTDIVDASEIDEE